MKQLLLIFLSLSFVGFSQSSVKLGTWRGVLLLNAEKNIELPFNFEVHKDKQNHLQLTIKNADERIMIDEVTVTKDSLNFKMPVFDSEFKIKIINDTLLAGHWINRNKIETQIIPFKAQYGIQQRFLFENKTTTSNFNGKWEVTFYSNPNDTTKAIGVFTNLPNSSIVYGTFLSETGDYRYLEGVEYKNKLYLSCFDGSHAYVFFAEYNQSQITNGEVYSGLKNYVNWHGVRNSKFELRDPEKLTYLKNPNDKIHIAFNNLDNKKVSLEDEKYKNKAVIIQIMGSWCPNCMDESAYLANVYKQYHDSGLEIIAIAYERTSDTERAKTNLKRLIKRFDIGYDVLLTGLTGGKQASESLPFLNGIMSFPTTIFLDKNHQVKSIYTGFSGPATGKTYQAYTAKTEKLIKELLAK